MTGDVTGSGALVERVRALCLAYPQTEERRSHGEACWFAGGRRMFVMFADRHHDDRVAFWAAAADGRQRRLVEDDPARFFVPPYVGTRGWVGVWLDHDPDWDRVELVVDEAWRCVAGVRLIQTWDRGRDEVTAGPSRAAPPGPPARRGRAAGRGR